LTETSCLHSKE